MPKPPKYTKQDLEKLNEFIRQGFNVNEAALKAGFTCATSAYRTARGLDMVRVFVEREGE